MAIRYHTSSQATVWIPPTGKLPPRKWERIVHFCRGLQGWIDIALIVKEEQLSVHVA